MTEVVVGCQYSGTDAQVSDVAVWHVQLRPAEYG